jgi:hypothetical protein
MRHLSYTNTSGAALDCRVLRLAGISDTSGVAIKDYSNIASGKSFIYTPSLSGLYTVATKVKGAETDYVIDEDFVPVYITAIHNNSASPIISGYSLKEFSDYFKLKLHLTDNMNSDVQFQNFTFEILYSYVDGEGDDYNAAVPEFTSALSPIIHGAKEHSSGGRYSYPAMMIRESDEYTTEHNIKAASDFYSYQHKAMFIGDTIMIPKINGQAEVGRYLIFSIRRRPLNRSIVETSVISQCFSAPVTIETSYNKIAALQTGVDPELDSRLTAVENTVSNMQPLPTVIDLSDGDYEIEGGKNSIVVVTANPKDLAIVLPAAIVELRVTIINQDDASVNIRPAGNDYINGSKDKAFELVELTSITFYCYADGYWATI